MKIKINDEVLEIDDKFNEILKINDKINEILKIYDKINEMVDLLNMIKDNCYKNQLIPQYSEGQLYSYSVPYYNYTGWWEYSVSIDSSGNSKVIGWHPILTPLKSNY